MKYRTMMKNKLLRSTLVFIALMTLMISVAIFTRWGISFSDWLPIERFILSSLSLTLSSWAAIMSYTAD